jgi:hypothetical protein
MKRIHNVVILTSGASKYPVQGLLDRVIQYVLSLKKNPILVLGEDGDEFLRDCRHIENCDLVYDEERSSHPLSGLASGLHATVGGVFALPLKEALVASTLNPSVWRALEESLATTGEDEFDIAQLQETNQNSGQFSGQFSGTASNQTSATATLSPQASSRVSLYPFVVTSRGVARLKKMAGESAFSWDDPRQVDTRYIPFSPMFQAEAA